MKNSKTVGLEMEKNNTLIDEKNKIVEDVQIVADMSERFITHLSKEKNVDKIQMPQIYLNGEKDIEVVFMDKKYILTGENKMIFKIIFAKVIFQMLINVCTVNSKKLVSKCKSSGDGDIVKNLIEELTQKEKSLSEKLDQI